MSPPVYEKHAPPPGLAPWVVAIWSLRLTPGEPHRILPDGYMDLIALPDGALLVAGPTTRPELAAPVDGVVRGLRLMPGAAPALLGVTAHELRDRSVPLSELWGAAAARPLAGTLLARAARARSAPDPLVGAVVAALVRDPSLEIAGLAREVALSERQLRRRFDEAVGYGPKRLARVLRLQRLLAEARRRPRAGGAELAFAAGYADQPHMTRDVGELAGVTPAALLAERGRLLTPSGAFDHRQ